jgi:rRNA maturation endonuclease Nob1
MERKAHLIKTKDAYNFYHVYSCSACQKQVDAMGAKYCPYCGAKFIGIMEIRGSTK